MSKLVIPIDVSQVADADRGQQKVRVAAKVGEKVVSQVASVKGGKAEVIPDATPVFPITCCYLLQLTVWKRNGVNCSSPVYYNRIHHSFTVTVGP